jgi:hypothetical protein
MVIAGVVMRLCEFVHTDIRNHKKDGCQIAIHRPSPCHPCSLFVAVGLWSLCWQKFLCFENVVQTYCAALTDPFMHEDDRHDP